jgi:hypothetical protein
VVASHVDYRYRAVVAMSEAPVPRFDVWGFGGVKGGIVGAAGVGYGLVGCVTIQGIQVASLPSRACNEGGTFGALIVLQEVASKLQTFIPSSLTEQTETSRTVEFGTKKTRCRVSRVLPVSVYSSTVPGPTAQTQEPPKLLMGCGGVATIVLKSLRMGEIWHEGPGVENERRVCWQFQIYVLEAHTLQSPADGWCQWGN